VEREEPSEKRRGGAERGNQGEEKRWWRGRDPPRIEVVVDRDGPSEKRGGDGETGTEGKDKRRSRERRQ
jgi:hypothetical protein